MALLQVNNLSKFFGSVALFTGLSLEINPGEKWGLIGNNGCGKSTLINILTQKEDYDQGEIHWSQNCRIGYLQQEPVFQGDTLYHELRMVYRKLDEMQAKMDLLRRRMDDPATEPQTLETLVAEFTEMSEAYAAQGGYQIEGRIQGVLRGLGFPKERWSDSPLKLSGGERTRLALGRMLLHENDLLFLDEPTNYLDLAAIEWLEDYLAEYRGALLVVSHDRYFLDRVVQGFYEMEQGQLVRYRGNYTAYCSQKTAQREAATKAYLQQEKRVAKLEKFVREARSTEKSKRQAHSIAKRLEKEERIARPPADERKMRVEFKTESASGQRVLELEGITKSFGTKTVLQKVNFTIYSGEKVGLIGPNGAGKTTLLKIILGLETADHGFTRLGYEVFPGYFSQMTEEADLEGTVLSQIQAAADLDNTEARTLLGRFLFSKDTVFKAVSDLSGGERRRLALLKLMLSNANFLIMDEPTNHLDLTSIETIEASLQDYDGTLLVVSHDRYFLNKIVGRYLLLEEGAIYEFHTYQEYLNWRQSRSEENTKSVIEKPKNESQQRRESTKESQRLLKRRQRDVEEVEAEIERLEQNQSELLKELTREEVQTDYVKSMEINEQLNDTAQKLALLYDKWEKAHEALNALE